MSDAREERLERLFEEAAAKPPDRRAAFLRGACEGDSTLRDTLSHLLADTAAAQAFSDGVLAPVVAGLAARAVDASPAAPDPLIGRQLAHFRVIERIAGGGMGLVYKATDLRLGRTVALKVLPAHLSADADAVRRFEREARAASALDHPGICPIHEIGATDDARPYIAMALCTGESLKEKVARGPLPVADVLSIIAQLGVALQRAHDAGIVHRDIKPANVMVTDDGVVKIVDFGIARFAGADVTREGAAVGTVAYMSPEQTRGELIDHRSDLWSLGAVLYEVLTAQRPFRGDSDQAVIHAIRHDAPVAVRALRPEVPAGLATIVSRCLETDPERRYQSAGAIVSDLASAGKGRAVRDARRSERTAAAGMLTMLAIAALVVLVVRTATPAPMRSLAVLPVAGGSAADELSGGMSELLANRLSHFSGLRRVISPASVARYRHSGKSSAEIGRGLGVDVIVEVTERRDEARVRIAVRIVDVSSGRARWSRTFERSGEEMLVLERDVAQAIARELNVALTSQEATRLVRAAPRVDPDAFALYLQGVREADLTRRIAALEGAIARDSTFALAHAHLAGLYIMVLKDRRKADRMITRAIELDPGLSEAYDALGLLRMWIDRDWPAAEQALRHAIALNPHNGVAHHELGQLLMRQARCDDAVPEEEQAVLINPGVSLFQSGLAEVYLYCRRYDDARKEFTKTLAIVRDSSQTWFNLGETYFHEGRHAQAIAMYERSARPLPGWVLAAVGRTAEARRSIEAAQVSAARRDFIAWNRARTQVSLGNHAAALTSLERALSEQSGLVVYLKVHPHFDALRPDPRFQRLLQRVGLEP